MLELCLVTWIDVCAVFASVLRRDPPQEPAKDETAPLRPIALQRPSQLTPREAPCANRRATGIACSTAHTSCNLLSLLASSNLHGESLRPELDPRHGFRISLHGALP